MSERSDHDTVQAALAAEATGALSPDERAMVAAHLEACDRCRRDLEELTVTVAKLSLRAPVRSMDEARSRRIRARLVGRAAAAPPSPSRRLQLLAGLGWGVAAGLATLLLTHHAFHQPLAYGWLAAAALLALLLVATAFAIRQHRELRRLRQGMEDRKVSRAPPRSRTPI